MSTDRTHRDMKWTPEQRAKHKALRDKFQSERPTPKELLDSGEYAGPIPHGVYLAFRRAILDLRTAREAAGLSLADVAERSGIDKAALSRLETGVTENPTLETLVRYAAAVGKQINWTLADLPGEPAVA
jgi:DNA-binding XRE family transcriptional regulator